MRKFFIIITGLFFSFLFIACQQYELNVEDYLSYWASEAYVKDHAVKAFHHNDADNILCVPSATDVAVTLTLHNPKHFPLVMPTPSKDVDNTEKNKNVIRFPGLDKQPQCGTDYTLVHTVPDERLQLVYKSAFLQTQEWGNGDIGPEIILKAQDGRPFKQKYSFKIRANTSPQKPNFTVAKTKGSSAYYVLCIAARDMDQKVPGGLVHKDLTRIEINGTAYGLSINEGQTAFIKPEAGVFIAHSEVEKLSDPNADDILSGGWVLYYKTDAEVKEGAAKKDYTIRLADAKGLVSEALNASTKPNRPESETLTITKGIESGSASGSASDPKIIGADGTGAELSVSSATGNTLVHCTLTDMGSGTAAEYTGNPVSVPLALNGEGAKTYKLDYYTDGEGFTATPVKTVYYKVLQKYTVTFDAKEGIPVPPQQVVLHGDKVSKPASPARTGYTFGEWYKDAACSGGQEWNFTTDMVTSNITLYAKWIPGTGTGYRVEHYQETTSDPAGQYPSSPSETTSPTPTGVTGHTFTTTDIDNMKKTYTGFEFDKQELTHPSIKADGSTVIKLFYKRKTVTVTFNPNGGTISSGTPNLTVSGRFGTALTLPTPVKTGYHLNPAGEWEPVSPAVPLGSSPYTFPAADGTYKANWTANTYIVRFNGGAGSSGSMTDQSFTYDEASKQLSQNTFTKTNYRFTGWATSFDSSTVVHTDKKSVRNLTATNGGVVNLYAVWVPLPKVTFKVEGGKGGKLQGTYGGGTPKEASGNTEQFFIVQYDDNSKIVEFTAVPASGWVLAEWRINPGPFSDGGPGNTWAKVTRIISDVTVTVKFRQTEISAGANAWGDLMRVVQDAPADSTIKLSGEIIATTTQGNYGQIEIKKNLQIESSSGSTATLNANSSGLGTNAHRIFSVQAGAKLTLKELTLKNGKTTTGNGGGIDSQGTLDLKQTNIEHCEAKNGGAISCSGNLTVNVGRFEANTATGSGGAIYVSGGTTKLTAVTIGGNGAIKANKAFKGGGIFFTGNGTKGEMAQVGILYNQTAGTGSGPLKGGGMCIENSASVTMTGGKIEHNTSQVSGKDAYGGGVFVGYYPEYCNATFTCKNVTISSNTADEGGAVYVASSAANAFYILGTSQVTLYTGPEENQIGKNDIYLRSNCKITVNSNSLPGPLYKAARISVDRPGEYNTNRVVLVPFDSSGMGVTYKMFIVTPRTNGNSNWYVGSDGRLRNSPPP